MIEPVALCDENKTPLKQAHRRSMPLPPGTYMIIAAVWVVNRQGKVLITLRSPQKEVCPNMWENPGGAVRPEETSAQGAARELREETGISVEEHQLELLCSRRTGGSFVDTYLLFLPEDGRELVLQPGETAAARWVTIWELEQVMNSGEMAPPIAKDLSLALPRLKQRMEQQFNGTGRTAAPKDEHKD